MTVLVDLRRKLEMLQFWHGFIVNVVLQQQASLHDLTETAKLLELCKKSALASALSSYKEKGPQGSKHILQVMMWIPSRESRLKDPFLPLIQTPVSFLSHRSSWIPAPPWVGDVRTRHVSLEFLFLAWPLVSQSGEGNLARINVWSEEVSVGLLSPLIGSFALSL